jgi:hypothetical protein
MADAVIYTISTHPCAHCAGERTVEEMSWRTPRFHVICQSCGNTVVGETKEEAVEAWDEANPAREISADEAHAVAVAMVSAALTPEIMQRLERAGALYMQTDGPDSVEGFLAWCLDHTTA